MTKNNEAATRIEVSWTDLGPIDEAALRHDLTEIGASYDVGASDNWGNVGVVAWFDSAGDVPEKWFSRKKSARQALVESTGQVGQSDKRDRYEMADLEALVGRPTVAEMAAVVGVTARAVSRWKAHGLTDKQADRVACAYDLHPALVWPTFGVESWCPWDALAASDVSLIWTEMADIGGGGMALTQRGDQIILLHPSLADDDQAAAETLTHELIHHERGIYGWGDDNAHMPAEELIVQGLTDERMRGYLSGSGAGRRSEGARWLAVSAAGWIGDRWDPWAGMEASGVVVRWSDDRYRDGVAAMTIDGEMSMSVFEGLTGDDLAATAAVTRELIRHEVVGSWKRRPADRLETDERIVRNLTDQRMMLYRASVLADSTGELRQSDERASR